MKKRNFKTVKFITKFTAPILVCALLLGCGRKIAVDCPYTDLKWDATTSDLFEAEGKEYDTYDSTYGGTTYTYTKTYLEKDGTIKYMYDEKEELMCVAWAYSSADADELKELYDKILAETEKDYGKSDYTTEESTNYGASWEMKGGHIIISVFNTTDNKALQIAYTNPADYEDK